MTRTEQLKQVLHEINMSLLDIEITERTIKKQKLRHGFDIKDNSKTLGYLRQMEEKLGQEKEGITARQDVVVAMLDEEMKKETV